MYQVESGDVEVPVVAVSKSMGERIGDNAFIRLQCRKNRSGLVSNHIMSNRKITSIIWIRF